jgi:histidinol-phosphate/aromatic aminotransferase/cobyric acid decarboxylase-like protein
MMHIGSGKRDEWEFEYTASKLAEGAQAQKEYRLSRVKVWTEAKAKLMAEVKESGLEVTESVAAAMGSTYANVRGAGGPTINVRADLQTKLQECHAKIQAHDQAAAEYDGWVQVLAANPESRLKLTQADWLYFFGKV